MTDNQNLNDNPADEWRQQMVEARREQILQATAEVFGEKGFHRATIRDIARRAGIADGTIYNYFDNKRELLMGLVDKLAFASLRDLFANSNISSPEELLRALLQNRMQFVRDNRHIFISVFPEVISSPELRAFLFADRIPQFMRQVEDYLHRGVAAGALTDVDPKVVTHMMLGALFSYALIDSAEEVNTFGDMTDDELVDQWTRLLFYGLATRPEVG